MQWSHPHPPSHTNLPMSSLATTSTMSAAGAQNTTVGNGVQGPKWKDPLLDWQTLCATSHNNITDVCCAQQHGSVWADNSTFIVGAGQHSCLINTTTEADANASRQAFIDCVVKTPGAAISMCGINNPKNKSSARRTAMLGAVGLVWVAAGCVLVL